MVANLNWSWNWTDSVNTKISDDLTSYTTRHQHQQNWQQWAFSWGHYYFVHVRHISWLKKTSITTLLHLYCLFLKLRNIKKLSRCWSQTVFIVKLSSLCGMNQGDNIGMMLKCSWNFSSVKAHTLLSMDMIFCVSFKGCFWNSQQNNPFIERYDFTHSINLMALKFTCFIGFYFVLFCYEWP